jgi:hypothetical protein
MARACSVTRTAGHPKASDYGFASLRRRGSVNVPTAPELARRLADTLQTAGVPYAIGGALALGVWGFPRATNDVDLDIFVGPDELDPVLEILRAGGFEIELEAALASARTRGDFKLWWQGMRVDVFVASIPLYDAVQQRVRQAPLEGRPAWFLSPEDLAIFKMLFYRTKDILDLERMIAFIGPAFDRAYVRQWLVDLVGVEDERLRRWDALAGVSNG